MAVSLSDTLAMIRRYDLAPGQVLHLRSDGGLIALPSEVGPDGAMVVAAYGCAFDVGEFVEAIGGWGEDQGVEVGD